MQRQVAQDTELPIGCLQPRAICMAVDRLLSCWLKQAFEEMMLMCAAADPSKFKHTQTAAERMMTSTSEQAPDAPSIQRLLQQFLQLQHSPAW
jgi:hypothetical protein